MIAAIAGLGIGIIAIILIVHFLPTAIALGRGHPNTLAIFLVNLLLGWTFIGWVVALVWSVTATRNNNV